MIVSTKIPHFTLEAFALYSYNRVESDLYSLTPNAFLIAAAQIAGQADKNDDDDDDRNNNNNNI